jgi:hypothetical protein
MQLLKQEWSSCAAWSWLVVVLCVLLEAAIATPVESSPHDICSLVSTATAPPNMPFPPDGFSHGALSDFSWLVSPCQTAFLSSTRDASTARSFQWESAWLPLPLGTADIVFATTTVSRALQLRTLEIRTDSPSLNWSRVRLLARLNFSFAVEYVAGSTPWTGPLNLFGVISRQIVVTRQPDGQLASSVGEWTGSLGTAEDAFVRFTPSVFDHDLFDGSPPILKSYPAYVPAKTAQFKDSSPEHLEPAPRAVLRQSLSSCGGRALVNIFLTAQPGDNELDLGHV